MELLQQLDAIFTLQRGLVFAMVMICVVCIIQLFLDKQRKKVDDVIVQFDVTGNYWHVAANCKCCGKQVLWTTNCQGAQDKEWVRNMSTVYCCEQDSIVDMEVTI